MRQIPHSDSPGISLSSLGCAGLRSLPTPLPFSPASPFCPFLLLQPSTLGFAGLWMQNLPCSSQAHPLWLSQLPFQHVPYRARPSFGIQCVSSPLRTCFPPWAVLHPGWTHYQHTHRCLEAWGCLVSRYWGTLLSFGSQGC